MPDLKISQLPVASTPLAGTELVPIVQGGVTDRTTVAAFLSAGLPVSATTLSASGAVTLSGGTANGVLYLDGSKVATSGTALAFNGTSLLVGKNSSDANNWGVQNYATNAFGSGMQFTYGGVGSAGLWVPAASSLAFGADAGSGTTELMRLTSTGLGIGTSSPGYKLVVAGTAGSAVLNLLETGVRSWGIRAGGAVTNTFDIADFTAGVTRLTIDSSGNLGLGVTPSATGASQKSLEISSLVGIVANPASNTVSAYSHNAYYDGTNWKYRNSSVAAARYEMTGANAGSTHAWYVSAGGTAGNAISFTQAMTLDASGNLGIGITNPGYRLEVEISSGPYSARFNNSNSSTNQYNVVRFEQAAAGSATGYVGTGGSAVGNASFANNFVVGTQTSNALVFNTNDTERARITSTGNVVAGGSVALATTATDGFLYVPTCAGTPTGTPTAITGMAPIVVDTTNNKMYFYSGGAWRDAGP